MSCYTIYKILPRDIVDNCVLPYLLPNKMKNILHFRTVMHELRCIINYNNFGELQPYMDYYFKIHTVKDLLRHLKINTKGEDLKDLKINEFVDYRDYPKDITTNTTYYNLESLETFSINITVSLKYGELEKYIINRIRPFSEKTKKYFMSDITNKYSYHKTACINKGHNVRLKEDYQVNMSDFSVMPKDLPMTTPITAHTLENHKYRISRFNQKTQAIEPYNTR